MEEENAGCNVQCNQPANKFKLRRVCFYIYNINIYNLCALLRSAAKHSHARAPTAFKTSENVRYDDVCMCVCVFFCCFRLYNTDDAYTVLRVAVCDTRTFARHFSRAHRNQTHNTTIGERASGERLNSSL